MQPLIIKDWSDGVAGSPHKGFGLMRNADIQAFPSAVKVAKKPTSLFENALNLIFTADATTDVMTMVGGTVPKTGTAITVSNSGGALPSGLSGGTIYYIQKLTSSTFRISATLSNAIGGVTYINITDNGTGTQNVVSVNPGTITNIVFETKSMCYFRQDSNGRVWFDYAIDSGSTLAGLGCFLLVGNTLTDAHGEGLCLFTVSDSSATYLFTYRAEKIDVVGDVSGNLFAVTWTNGWKTMNSVTGRGNSHYSILGQDNIVYFCDDRYVGSIKENSGSVFAPGSAGTYTYNNQALDLPPREITEFLEEQGINLLIASKVSDKIYPWDRISDSFSIPIEVPERGVMRLKNIGGTVFILAGQNGNIYQTPGNYVKWFTKLPDAMVNNSATLQSTIVTWGGIEALSGALLFGAGVLTTGNSGVYLLEMNGTLTLDNMPSIGSGTLNAVSLYARDEFYTMGYAGGADIIGTTRYANYETVIYSALYRVATKTEKGKYSTLEVQTADPASTGHIRVGWRSNTTGVFALLATFTADGTNTSFRNSEIGMTDLENVQIIVEMDGNIQLIEVRLIP